MKLNLRVQKSICFTISGLQLKNKLLFTFFLFSLFSFGQNKLIAHYPFDGNLNNTSGEQEDFTLIGNISYTSDRFNSESKALKINGDGAYIKTNFKMEGNWSISFWHNPQYISDNDQFLLLGDYTEGNDLHLKYTYGELLANFVNASTNKISKITTNKWYHIVLTFNGSNVMVYEDNILIGTIDQTPNFNFNGSLLRIGSRNGQQAAKLYIDDLRIYNYELTKTEIEKLFNSNQLETSPFAYYPFNGNVNDESGNENNGTVHSATLTTDRFGNENSAYYFDGENSYIDCGNFIDFGDSLNISGWYKIEGNPPNNPWIAFFLKDEYIPYFGMMYNTENKSIRLYNKNSTYGIRDVNIEIPYGEWFFISLNYDGSTFSIYYNGKKIDSFSYSNSITDGNSFLIGVNNKNTYHWFGSIDDVRVYNHSLTENEINDLYYENGWVGSASGEFEFVPNAKIFIPSAISTNSKSYFYYYINENNLTPPVGTTFNFNLSSGNKTIPSGGEYLGNGILQFWASLDENFDASNLQILVPSTILRNGIEISFKNVPNSYITPVQHNSINQSIDIFAGGSVGVKLIAGGVGAGPSVAAASLSLNGTGGMGINFHQDLNGNEFVTRRFEAGVGMSVEAPSINAVVGDIQAGINASVMVKGVMGQTMYFPSSLNTETALKAKAAYILETFTMGGVELSPFASIFLKALKNSLVKANPDLSAIYTDLYYSSQTGQSVEGEASVGFSIASGEGSEQTKLDIVEFGGYVALTKQIFENIQNSDKSFKFGYASGFDISALNFEVANVDFGKVYDFKFGTDFSVGANYNPNSGINSFELSFGATPSAQISFASFSTSYNYVFLIPKSIISKNQNSDNLIGAVAPMFIPGLPKKRFKVGMNYFTENLDEIYADNPESLDMFNDHIIMQKTKSSTKGLDVDAKIGLDAALGIGAGLKLGIHFSYIDEMTYPKNQYVVAHNKILPIVEYNDIPDEQRIFTIKDEIQDVFQGTVLLIKEPLNNLLSIIENSIESGKEFTVNMINGAAKLTGKIVGNGLRWVTRTSNPTTKSVQKSAFLESKVINAYSSRRIIHIQNKSASLAKEEEESVMYIVSENVNISLVDSSNEVINEFEPVTLSIAIDNKKMNELGFGEEEKYLAKMYQYDAENLVWIELAGDSNNHIDTVSTQITKSESYAIGIELNSSNDNTAPDIQDYYPKNGDKIGPITNFWAKLYESPTGVGIDFSQTVIKIDDIEVDAVWNPVNNIISFESVDSLNIGQHTFELIVKDYNGNINSIKSTVSVSYTTSINLHKNIVRFDCYPVPTIDILNIEINSKTSEPILISIYNQVGQLVSNTFECQPINGYIKVQWDRTGMNYQHVKSGIYFVRIKQNDNIMVKKIVLK